MPLVFMIRFMKFCMRTEIVDPNGCMDTERYPFITVTWHNRLMFFPAMFPKKARRKTAALISASRDGQYVADVVSLFGIRSVRGSSSRKGAAALSGALKYLKEKCNVSITPDGPRGPKYKMSKGPIIMASKTGYDVLPIAVNYSSYWALKSWDEFQIPKPWAKISLVLGTPISIPKDLDDNALTYWRDVVEEKLNEISLVER